MQSIFFKEAQMHYLLSNPANAQRLLRSLDKARSGQLMQKELIEE